MAPNQHHTSDTALSQLIVDGFISTNQRLDSLGQRVSVIETRLSERSRKQTRTMTGWSAGITAALVGVIEALHRIGWLK